MYKNRQHPTEVECRLFCCPILLGRCRFCSFLKLLSYRHTAERVSFLVGHHHTYTGIDGLDYQILVEADFLVNLFEGNTDTAHIRATYDNIFRTETGKKICREMFGL